jgi:hypothetical protein
MVTQKQTPHWIRHSAPSRSGRVTLFGRMLPPSPTKEGAMAIVAVFQDPSLTLKQYEDVIRSMMNGKTKPESPSDWPVKGLLAHVAGEGCNGFRVVDVWESEEAFNQFGETLMPILQKLGINAQPDIYPAHAFVTA